MSGQPMFVRVAALSELREGKGRRVTVDGEECALWLVRGTVYAVGNICAHQHRSTMHEGTLRDLTVSCPMHGWRYSLETGRAVEGEGRIPVYPVQVRGNIIFVGVSPRTEHHAGDTDRQSDRKSP